jgi:hypothetical protein
MVLGQTEKADRGAYKITNSGFGSGLVFIDLDLCGDKDLASVFFEAIRVLADEKDALSGSKSLGIRREAPTIEVLL